MVADSTHLVCLKLINLVKKKPTVVYLKLINLVEKKKEKADSSLSKVDLSLTSPRKFLFVVFLGPCQICTLSGYTNPFLRFCKTW